MDKLTAITRTKVITLDLNLTIHRRIEELARAEKRNKKQQTEFMVEMMCKHYDKLKYLFTL